MPVREGEAPSPDDVVAFARAHDVHLVDLKFTDLPGTWQHFAVAARELGEGLLTDGAGFDGSSIRGFQEINESDMLLVPDPATAFIDPFHEFPTLSLICDVRDPITGESYTRDPRNVAHKAQEHLAGSGIADVAYFGPEADFYIFEHVAYEQQPNRGFYEVDSGEGFWNAGLGFGRAADTMQVYKYVARNVARQAGKVATFMPKPIFEENGSGMHTHMSLWKDGETIMFDDAGD